VNIVAPQQIRIARSANILDERPGYRLSAPWGHIAVLEGGGHICELGLASVPDVNPLWRPQWSTMDPHRYAPAAHGRKYGPAPDGRLLAGIAGHSVSFDQFGPPSPEETAAGLTTHGEAPCARWKRLPSTNSTTLRYGCTLPEADIEFTRSIALENTSAVIYCEEQARNLSSYDRPICWNEHVTFGPPFLDASTLFDMPATLSKVCPAQYSQRNPLQADAHFLWPHAPRKGGGQVNLRTGPEGSFGHYTAQLLDPAVEIGYISAANPRQGLLVVYAFRRSDFPWVGNWQESSNRQAAPWRGRTVCRGLEFSTTPFAIPRRETLDRGPLFDERTYRWLPAKSTETVRFVILLFAIPPDFAGVASLQIRRGRAMLTEAAPGGRRLGAVVNSFLDARARQPPVARKRA